VNDQRIFLAAGGDAAACRLDQRLRQGGPAHVFILLKSPGGLGAGKTAGGGWQGVQACGHRLTGLQLCLH
jgi:hypothetical protein